MVQPRLPTLTSARQRAPSKARRSLASLAGRGSAHPAFGQIAEPFGHRPPGRPIDEFDCVDDRNGGAGGDLRDAADIAGRDHIRLEPFDVGDLAVTQPVSQRGLEDVVGAR